MSDKDNIRGDGLIRSLKVELRPLETLRNAERNARTHNEKQIGQIASSIRQFGFTNPIIVNEEGVIVAGHGRHAAAKLLGLADVPVILIGDLEPAELRAYALADNRINVSYHLEHHLFPSVPWNNLRRLHVHLMTDPIYVADAHVTRGYWGMIRELMPTRGGQRE